MRAGPCCWSSLHAKSRIWRFSQIMKQPRPWRLKIKDAGRILLTHSLGRCNVRVGQPKKNILLFSSRRSGSTWMLELLSCEPKTKYISQPYDTLLNQNPYKKFLPRNHRGFFIDEDEGSADRICRYYEDLCSGKKLIHTQWRIWKKSFHCTFDRLIFKLFYVKNYMGLFSERYSDEVVYLVRHPVAVALSNIKKRWPNPLPAFMEHPDFADSHLDHRQKELIASVQDKGSDLVQYVAGWFVENLIPMSQLENHNWCIIRYEDLVAAPAATIDQLCSRLDLSNKEAMLRHHRVPSASSRASADRIQSNDATVINDYWREQMDPADHPLLEALFAAFDNPLYRW